MHLILGGHDEGDGVGAGPAALVFAVGAFVEAEELLAVAFLHLVVRVVFEDGMGFLLEMATRQGGDGLGVSGVPGWRGSDLGNGEVGGRLGDDGVNGACVWPVHVGRRVCVPESAHVVVVKGGWAVTRRGGDGGDARDGRDGAEVLVLLDGVVGHDEADGYKGRSLYAWSQ